MRKLFVLIAILFMAPIAGGRTVTLTGTATSVELSVFDATYDPYLAIVMDAPGVLSNFAAGPAAPSVSGSFGPVTINGATGEVWGFGTALGETYQDGLWLSADWHATSPVTVYAYETLDGGQTWILLIPEPMTIGLLGLGGLFLLRRRIR